MIVDATPIFDNIIETILYSHTDLSHGIVAIKRQQFHAQLRIIVYRMFIYESFNESTVNTHTKLSGSIWY